MRSKISTSLRFWTKVYADPSGCWLWIAAISSRGYGQFTDSLAKQVSAHRFAYELMVGPIPEGLTIDHLCRVRHCVNPAHMEPVPCGINVKRGIGLTAINATKTHCKHGHPFDEANTYHYRYKHGIGRACRICNRAAQKRFATSHPKRAPAREPVPVGVTRLTA